jgi:hypothetical protein
MPPSRGTAATEAGTSAWTISRDRLTPNLDDQWRETVYHFSRNKFVSPGSCSAASEPTANAGGDSGSGGISGEVLETKTCYNDDEGRSARQNTRLSIRFRGSSGAGACVQGRRVGQVLRRSRWVWVRCWSERKLREGRAVLCPVGSG